MFFYFVGGLAIFKSANMHADSLERVSGIWTCPYSRHFAREREGTTSIELIMQKRGWVRRRSMPRNIVGADIFRIFVCMEQEMVISSSGVDRLLQ